MYIHLRVSPDGGVMYRLPQSVTEAKGTQNGGPEMLCNASVHNSQNADWFFAIFNNNCSCGKRSIDLFVRLVYNGNTHHCVFLLRKISCADRFSIGRSDTERLGMLSFRPGYAGCFWKQELVFGPLANGRSPCRGVKNY